MNNITLSLLVVLLVGVSGFFVFSTQKATSPLPSPVSPTTAPTIPAPTGLGRGGNSYSDPSNIFTFLYPTDYTIDTQDPVHVRIYKRGESQRPQSEMSDGALVVFEALDLKGTKLETWVDTHIKQSTADGTTEITFAKKPIMHNGYPGFQYTLRGLGTSQNIVLQKDANSTHALLITFAISDPNQKGYQDEVDSILQSITLAK